MFGLPIEVYTWQGAGWGRSVCRRATQHYRVLAFGVVARTTVWAPSLPIDIGGNLVSDQRRRSRMDRCGLISMSEM
jgi:hypothetical protein